MTTIGMLAAAVVNLAACVCPQQNSAPNPYRTIENWAKLPEGRMWGSTSVSPHAKTERMARELKNFQNANPSRQESHVGDRRRRADAAAIHHFINSHDVR
jgi:hypothetical protein